jgi:hypothetical protein
MANDDKSTQAKAEAKETPAEEPTYHIDRLIAEAEDFFGQPAHVVAGALHDGRKQNFTRTEVEQAVKTWLRREVTTG